MADDARPASTERTIAPGWSPWPPDAVAGRSWREALPVRVIAPSSARRLAVVALSIGWLAQILIVGQRTGINVLVAAVTLLAAATILRRRRMPFDRLDAWLPVAAVVFAGFAALRTDRALVTFDVLIAAALVCASIAAMAGIAMTRRPLGSLVTVATHGTTVALGGATRLRSGLRAEQGMRRHLASAGPVVRGLLLALPVVLVFIALFSTADAVFAVLLDRAFGVRIDPSDLIWRTVLAGAAAWVAGGLLVLVDAATRRIRHAPASTWGAIIGPTEGVTLLAAVDLVFLSFVLVQAGYLFGGRDTLAETGLTYSEYARRGFFELVAAVVLVGGLLFALESIVHHRTRAYRLLAIALVALTGAVLASGAFRLGLYQQAYGWTELRFFVVAGIVWLALCLVVAVVGILADRNRWLIHAAVVLGLAVTAAVNVVGPQAFVAQQNVARALDPSLVPAGGRAGLDADYLIGLGDDAVPVLIAALPHLSEPDRTVVADRLERRLRYVRRVMPTLGWPSWNLARDDARRLLEQTPLP